MSRLYPALEPYAEHRISVAGQHCIYLEECGNPEGVPVAFLHGGPGSGCQPDHRRFFDPSHYRIVLMDQRGAGRSTPLGEVKENSTRDLLSDMETVRQRLAIDRWLLFGGSWGATLALLYAEAFPAAVSGLILRGVFLARQRDLDWFFSGDGVGRLLPATWSLFTRELPARALSNLIAVQHNRIHGSDKATALAAARAWSDWGTAVVTRTDAPETARGNAGAEDTVRLLAKARIESHYAMHRYFIEENQILRRADRLPSVPISIVHGRNDLACALESAWALHHALPASRLVVVEEGGHLMSEPPIIEALVKESDRMRRWPS